MRQIARLAVVMFVVAASISVETVPARAQGETTLPTLADVHSVEMDFISTFNGMPNQVCHYQLASINRYHSACRNYVTASVPDLGINLEAGRVTEFVYYDGKYYVRVNDETTWTVNTDEDYNPDDTLNASLFGGYMHTTYRAITNIGQTTVNGAAATQYQFWSTDGELNAASGGQYVYDAFVSAQHYMLKDQESFRGTLPSFGTGTLNHIWTYSNFNSEFSVAVPPAAIVKAAGRAPVGGWQMNALHIIH